jgi:LuxR family transcriptional regulator, maltose regulon positive regulatory protein
VTLPSSAPTPGAARAATGRVPVPRGRPAPVPDPGPERSIVQGEPGVPSTVLLRVPASKIVVPELPAEFTARPALRARLDLATPTQVVVVSAPAGSGKTLLLADWVRQADSAETAWVSVDADDNDPRRLWSAVLSALQTLPSLAHDGLVEDSAGEVGSRYEGDLVDVLAEMLDRCDPPVRVVLDDVQELTGQDVLRDLNRLFRLRPAGLRLVLASRSDPPISVPRLRLEGRLHELRADALRFSLADTSALLATAGLVLSPAQVAVLHARTEGWVAGLRLAALALRRAEDVRAFLGSFSGDERSVAEYLTGEVLRGLTPGKQDFLRVVSVCSPLAADLAAELSGRSDADRVLDELHHETALVERTSPGHYRIHPLLRSYLVADLARHRPETFRTLHAVAAEWWSVSDEPVHALRHAERAGNRGMTAELVRRSGVALLAGGDLGPLRRALAAVGAAHRATDPWLALTAAITHLDGGALPAAVTELHNARRAWPQSPDADLDALRGSAELLATARGLPGWSFVARGEDEESVRPELRALLHVGRGAAHVGVGDAKDPDLARAELERAVALAGAHDLGYLEVQSLWMLATLAAGRGDQRAMVALAERAVGTASRHGRHPSAWSAGPMGMLAYADLLRGEPAVAAGRSAEALATADTLPPEAAYTLSAVHGAALADLGQRAAGLAELRAARTAFGDLPAPAGMLASLAVVEHRVALLNGNLAAAAEVARWLGTRVGRTGETLLLRAWTEMARGRHDAARSLVAPLHHPDQPVLVRHTVVEAHLVEAEAALETGEEDAGRAALETALAAAETIGAIRPFALAGPLTQRELDARVALDRGTFTARVAAARAAVVPDPAVLLSDRETAVLALLPSLLSAREIANEFTVSVNTVKSHIRSIYAKLGVSSRRDAVLGARDRGLLP